MNTFTIIFLIAVFISSTVQFWLAKRQANYVAAHRATVPEAFKDKVPLAAHQKAADYSQAKLNLGNIDGVLSIVVLLLLTLGGGINLAFSYWPTVIESPLMAGVAAVVDFQEPATAGVEVGALDHVYLILVCQLHQEPILLTP